MQLLILSFEKVLYKNKKFEDAANFRDQENHEKMTIY